VTRLHDLFDHGGQSPWIDDLKRSYFADGELERWAAAGVRGVTSNPTIMARSISSGADYDEQFVSAIASGKDVKGAYWDLVVTDVEHALAVFQPVFEASDGTDGFVSLEVDPALAKEPEQTVASALELHRRIGAANLLVKIPATKEGIGAIETVIGEGHSVNVTLIFSLERYGAVIDAYLAGLERLVAQGGDPSSVASVASFFVSRVDTEVDRRLEAIASRGGDAATRALQLRGKAAIAQARLAYELFKERFSSDRFAALAARGARVQRPLWASTSTKNPAYPDLLYVDELIGPDTVNTMPTATLAAFLDHGQVSRTIDTDVDGARAVLEDLAEVGVSLQDVTDTLEREGVEAFARSFDEVIASLEAKASALVGQRRDIAMATKKP
jgi:transaldolase